MKLPDTDTDPSPDALLAALGEYITTAHAHLDAQNMVDLAGLDAVVATLCARVMVLSPEENKRYGEQLDALHARLGQLQEKMIATQAAIGAELAQTHARQKAGRAYRKDPV